MPPNFYDDQEDLLRERQQGKSWWFTALRPEAVCGFGVGNPMNLLMVIAVRLDLEGARHPPSLSRRRGGVSGEVLNLTNGDYFRWQHLWPKIAGTSAWPGSPDRRSESEGRVGERAPRAPKRGSSARCPASF